ncbi:MAG: hypothetical protein HYR85_02495 [Planctomycetes bacterium]|nr:hypothetical protein [Planctomycetota bacterium]MBI3846890.1 hypothetical protein [Planctomycetota bacterium]
MSSDKFASASQLFSPRRESRHVSRSRWAPFGLIALCWASLMAFPRMTRADGPSPLSAFTDRDQDGIPDELETSPRISTSTETADSDDDGFTDGQEIVQGSSPIDRLSTPTSSGSQRGIRILVQPTSPTTVALFFVTWCANAAAEFGGFRIMCWRNDRAADVTRAYQSSGQVFRSSDGRTRTLAVEMNAVDIQGRMEVGAEVTMDGNYQYDVTFFGRRGNDIFQARLLPSTDPDPLCQQLWAQCILAEYQYLGSVLVDGSSHSTGGSDPDKIFQETILVYAGGRFIVIRNNCDSRPNERCPLFLNTVGQTGRLGPRG